MRTTRKSKNKKSGGGAFFYLVLFIIGPIASIIIGGGIVKYLILPQFLPKDDANSVDVLEDKVEDQNVYYNTEDEDNEDNTYIEVQKSSFKLEGMELYSIQLGSFSTRDNAETLISDLANKGIRGYIVVKDNYKVFVGNYFTRKEADDRLIEIRKEYEDAFISTSALDGKEIEYNITDEENIDEIKEVVKIMNKSFSEESSLWERVLKEKNVDIIISMMKRNRGKIKSALNDINNNLESTSLINLMSKLEDISTKREDITVNLEENKGEYSKIYEDYNRNLLEYINIIK